MALLFLLAGPALATNRTVTNLNDTGVGSLRNTIAASANGDTIDFAVTGTITLTSGELVIGRSITITGPAGGITVSGNNSSRVFDITNGTSSGPTVALAGLTVTNGNSTSSSGAGILNEFGTLTVNNCALRSNTAPNDGGGVLNEGGTLMMTNCTLSGNTGVFGGGGIENISSGDTTLTNCTLSGNSSPGDTGSAGRGGGISNLSGTVTLTNCTLSGNSTSGAGGGLANFNNGGNPPIAILLNTIIAGNTSTANIPDPDVAAFASSPVTSQGHNLIGKTDGSSGWVATDLTGTSASPLDPLLSPLQNNGGPTQTMALQQASAARDAGDDSVLGSPLNLTTDQRGPGFPRKLNTHVDIGAFEFDYPPQSGPSFTVTNNFDHDDGICGAVDCTLREAINAANAASGANTITFAPNVTGTITLSGVLGALNLADSTTITGPGARLLAVSGNGATPVFDVGAGTSTISGLTIRDGMVTGSAAVFTVGGGIFNSATLTLSDCTFSGNQALGGNSTSTGGSGGNAAGGAIYNTGVLTLDRCTFNGNGASGGFGGGGGGSGGSGSGGGVYNNATLAINNCTFNNNSALGTNGGNNTTGIGGAGGNGSGGAVFNLGMMSVTAATLNANTGSGGAGGSGSHGRNGAPGVGTGGLAAGGGNSAVGDTISAGNTGNNGGGLDVSGTFTSNGYNFIGSGDHSNGFSNGVNHDQVGTDALPIIAQLGSLQNNGGPTDTMALLSNSPAINKGDPNAQPQDQRYYLRSGAPDIGAFEFGGTLAPVKVVSRKTHGSAGTFDINLPFAGPVAVECRKGGGTNSDTHQVIMTFPVPVTATGASATPDPKRMPAATGNVGSFSVNGLQVTVNLTGVSNAQTLTVNLTGVSDGVNTNNLSVRMGVLLGDVNGNGIVSNGDVSLVQAQVAQTVTSSNFRDDVNANGILSNGDVSITKAQVGQTLP